MNVYDFDKTIIEGDSTVAFLKYLLITQKGMWRALPGAAANALLFALRLREKQAFKEKIFTSFFTKTDDISAALDAFWDKNILKIKPWYVKNSRFDDVVITASPEFLVKAACARIGVKTVLGSPVDPKTGKYFGRNCHGAEKIARYRATFGDTSIENFYSDSHSDDPMAGIALRAHMVSGEYLSDWVFR